jgi:hypothetical protein
MATDESRLSNRWAGLNREKLGNLGNVLNREKLGQAFSREKLGNVNLNKTERWASVLGGAALAALAMRSGRGRNGAVKGAAGLAALAGLQLLWRGATGHCAVYEKMGIDRTYGEGAGHGTALASQRVSGVSGPSRLDSGSNPFDDGRQPLVNEEPSTETNPTF